MIQSRLLRSAALVVFTFAFGVAALAVHPVAADSGEYAAAGRPSRPERPGRPTKPTPGSGFTDSYSGTLSLLTSKTFKGATCKAPVSSLALDGSVVERTVRGKGLISFAVNLGGTSLAARGERKSSSSFVASVTQKANGLKTINDFKATSVTSTTAQFSLKILIKKGRKKQCQAQYGGPVTRQ